MIINKEQVKEQRRIIKRPLACRCWQQRTESNIKKYKSQQQPPTKTKKEKKMLLLLPLVPVKMATEKATILLFNDKSWTLLQHR